MKWEIQEAASSTFPVWAWVDGAVDGLKRNFGKGLNIHVYLGKKGRGYEYFKHDELIETGRFILDELKKKSVRDKVVSKWSKQKNSMDRIFNFIGNSNLKSLNDKQIKEIFIKLVNEYSDYYGLMMFPEPVELVIDSYFKDFTKSLNKKLKKELSLLSTPPSLSFIQKHKLSLLSILDKIPKNKRKKYFSGDIKKMICFIKEDIEIFTLFINHIENFAWLRTNYLYVPKLTLEEVLKLSVEIIKNEGIIEEKNKLLMFAKKIKTDKRDIIKNNNFPKEIREIIAISDFVGYLHDERKEYTLKWIYYSFLILKEVGKRFGYSLNELKFCTKEDVENILKNRKVSKKEIKEKYKAYAYVKTLGQYKEYVGNKALKYEKMFISKKDNGRLKIQGMGVSPGKAIGKVKIIHFVNKAKDFQDGDILVAPMTRPEYMPLMAKAAAIVTDQGGITSHAAIISRELKKPCIVGTKDATKILKEGDLVEVNANHGVVRKI